MNASELLHRTDDFASRHIGPRTDELAEMVESMGYDTVGALIDATVPAAIRLEGALDLPEALQEGGALEAIAAIASDNRVARSLIGMGYYDTITPPVLLRNILENPGWYTQYTPYQAEISQGRLEALLNFQTMVADLAGLPLSNASLLDESTAAAEAMMMAWQNARGKRATLRADRSCHPQTLEVVRTRAEALGVTVEVVDFEALATPSDEVFAVLTQYPNTEGGTRDLRALATATHDTGALLIVASDLMALLLLESPGSQGADIAVGSSQRFGVPLGFGGPHAAWIACDDRFARLMPGRIVGVSKDRLGRPAYRLALQTREQHIRRDRATSNICTAQVLLAIMAGMYAVYHGPKRLRQIAERIHGWTSVLRHGLTSAGLHVRTQAAFDTLVVETSEATADLLARAKEAGFNLRPLENGIGISLDERTSEREVRALLSVFLPAGATVDFERVLAEAPSALPSALIRTSEVLTHEVFHRYHSEHEMLRYLHRLQGRDLSLTSAMIPLGSCTMKLNATVEMIPISWPAFAQLHPFAPAEDRRGYERLFADLTTWLSEITGMAETSLQPNAGSQGEYAGLLVIRAYHVARGEAHRNVCLIPTSAHGTNPASAVMAGFRVVPVRCDDQGNIDVADLAAKAEKHADDLGALMITYPSTHGVFEEGVREICAVVHQHGGQVYMDGANMNAQVGLCRPGDIGADVCHLNLHKTFCIPHGGGGPGMGPICVREHLAPFLPGHSVTGHGGPQAIGAISAATWGSPSILPIPWVYIAAMGADGLRKATEAAIVNANYMAHRLQGHYDILYRGRQGTVAHEFVLDCRSFKQNAGIEVEDIAKRLMDYGFHAPTMSWPVPGTLMVEPTESESREELDRFCDAMIAIRNEIRQIEDGTWSREDNPLRNAPHTAAEVTATAWNHAYSREVAAWPTPAQRLHKFWPAVARVDNAWGDRNLVCTCPPMSEFAEDAAE